MSTHNIRFYGELTKIILQLSSNTLLICSPAIFFFEFFQCLPKFLNIQLSLRDPLFCSFEHFASGMNVYLALHTTPELELLTRPGNKKQNMSLITRKTVLRVFDKVRLKRACAATETS